MARYVLRWEKAKPRGNTFPHAATLSFRFDIHPSERPFVPPVMRLAMRKYLRQQFGADNYAYTDQGFVAFRKPGDLALFVMRWSGEIEWGESDGT
jgi:hypothetical protein